MTKPKSTMPLSNIAEINPSVNLTGLQDADEVSFVPMADVTESGRWVTRQTRPLKDVRVGYTGFQEGDVLFAKITPCMENGKGAHAIGLVNGFGFGSTEFHVLRAKGENSPRFIFHWLQSTEARSRAIAYMGGSAGQQRVQRIFFDKFEIPELASEEQVRAAEILDTLEGAIEKSEALIAKLKQVRAGMLHDLLTYGVDENGEVRDIQGGDHPKTWKSDFLGNVADFYSGGTPSKSRPDYWRGDFPLLTPKDMKRFELNDTSDHVTEEAASHSSKYSHKSLSAYEVHINQCVT